MRVLITGGAGFIGSTLADKLLGAGHQVICFDNFDPFYPAEIKHHNISLAELNPNYSMVKGDITVREELKQCFVDNDLDLVIHLAAKAGVRPSIQDPHAYFDVNVMGTLNLLELMQVHKVNKLIFSSSSSVYGNNKKIPFSEDDLVDNPISPYAASKKAGELICHAFHHLYGMDILCLRFFTVYGPRQRPDLAIHKFTKALLKNEEISFFGDGTTRRDYTHISDIINGIEGAIINLKGYDIFNLGESQTTSLATLIDYLEKYTGKKARLNKLPMQAGDVAVTYADIAKARKILNYNPGVEIQEGLKDFVNWYKLNK